MTCIWLYSRFAVRNSKKSSWPVSSLRNRESLKDLNDSKLIVYESKWFPWSSRTNLIPFRNFRGPLFHKAVTSSSHILWKRVHFCFQTFANKKKSLDGATCLRFITFHSMVLIAECFYEYFFSLSSTWVILFLIAQLARSDPRNSFSACWPFAFSCSFAQIFIMKVIRKISLWPK